MPYRIPDEDALSAAIKAVMTSHPHIDSQKELVRLVRMELSKIDEDYRASGERIRKIGIDRGIVKLTIEYHETYSDAKPEICPVCKNAMEPVMNMSLEGNVVEVKRKCTVCPYNMGKITLVPGRYGFSRTGHGEVPENVKRIRKLKKAQARLNEAYAMVLEAVNMTGLEMRAENIKELLDRASYSRDQAGSIVNLISDLESIDCEDPGWTRPTVSVKNVNRKDI